MKYLVTKIFVGKKGGLVFNPALDAEVFDHYFAPYALKQITL